MNCLICGSNCAIEVIKNEKYFYKGHSIVINDIKQFECSKCGESVTEMLSYLKTVPILKEFHKKVDEKIK